MAKAVLAAVLDAALNYIKTNVAQEHACTSQPTTRTEAITTFNLATTALVNADVTLANGDVSGRKATMGAKTGASITTSGTAQHVALTSGTELLLVTTCSSQALTSGGTVDFPSWKYEINQPT